MGCASSKPAAAEHTATNGTTGTEPLPPQQQTVGNNPRQQRLACWQLVAVSVLMCRVRVLQQQQPKHVDEGEELSAPAPPKVAAFIATYENGQMNGMQKAESIEVRGSFGARWTPHFDCVLY